MTFESVPYDMGRQVSFGSDIASVQFDGRCLVVTVGCDPMIENRIVGLRITFAKASAFRYLDELDLARYWSSGGFTRGHHVISVLAGGWKSEEDELQGWDKERREWMIVTGNGCLSVFADGTPEIEEGEFDELDLSCAH